MPIIRVNPTSVQSYGTSTQTNFNEMRSALVTLTTDVVNVRYFGPNAVNFKTQCGAIAADFANKLYLDLAAMAEAVRVSTTNIASSLGGAPLTIQLESQPIVAPVPETVDYVDVDTAALDGLTTPVSNHFTSLRSGLDLHLSQLQQTDWEGNAKTSAVEQVTGFTNAARGKCDEAEESILRFIREQITSVTSADR